MLNPSGHQTCTNQSSTNPSLSNIVSPVTTTTMVKVVPNYAEDVMMVSAIILAQQQVNACAKPDGLVNIVINVSVHMILNYHFTFFFGNFGHKQTNYAGDFHN